MMEQEQQTAKGQAEVNDGLYTLLTEPLLEKAQNKGLDNLSEIERLSLIFVTGLDRLIATRAFCQYIPHQETPKEQPKTNWGFLKWVIGIGATIGAVIGGAIAAFKR